MIHYICDRCGKGTGAVMGRVRVSYTMENLQAAPNDPERGRIENQAYSDFCHGCAREVWLKMVEALREKKEGVA